jgi:CRISPR-associated endonuclease/helicase Cas3
MLTFVKAMAKKKAGIYHWDHLDESWEPVRPNSTIVPGMQFLLDVETGGYSKDVGWVGRDWKKKRDGEVESLAVDDPPNSSMSTEHGSFIGREISIQEHCREVSARCGIISRALGIRGGIGDEVEKAGLWHDVGKAHPAFQNAITEGVDNPANVLLAKSKEKRSRLQYFTIKGEGKEIRKYFRHELASALALRQQESTTSKCLAPYLVAAHHGKVRLSIRSLPDETEPGNILFARGVWDGDELPLIPGLLDARVTLDLSPMMLGEGSWLEMTLGLLDEHGPFNLALYESVLRVSDWMVSRQEEVEQ